MGWLSDFAGSADTVQELAAQGRNGDTMLAHITPEEAALLKARGGSGTINPTTGLPEFWPDWVDNTISSVADVGSNAVSSIGDVVSGGVKGVGDLIGNTVGSVGDALKNIDFSDPTTLALIAAAAYGMYDPEMFAGLGGAGDLTGEGALTTAGEEGTSAALTSGSAGQASNLALSSELPAGYTPGVIDSTVSGAGTGSTVAGPATLAETTAGTDAAATSAGSTGTGLNSSGYLGSQGIQSTVPGYTGSIGYGAGGEGLTLSNTSALSAPSTINPEWSAAVQPAENTWALSDLGNAVTNGAKSLGSTIMDNKLATAMIGSSLYDMYAKNQMGKKLDEERQRQQQRIDAYYAPGSSEYNQLVEGMKRQAAQAGRPMDSSAFAGDIAGKVATAKANMANGSTTSLNQLLGTQLNNQYGGLNTLFNNLAMQQILAKKGYA